jgi:hypothetical protein
MQELGCRGYSKSSTPRIIPKCGTSEDICDVTSLGPSSEMKRDVEVGITESTEVGLAGGTNCHLHLISK